MAESQEVEMLRYDLEQTISKLQEQREQDAQHIRQLQGQVADLWAVLDRKIDKLEHAYRPVHRP